MEFILNTENENNRNSVLNSDANSFISFNRKIMKIETMKYSTKLDTNTIN